MVKGTDTKEDPWVLKTPPLSSDYTIYKDMKDGQEVLVCTVGSHLLVAESMLRG